MKVTLLDEYGKTLRSGDSHKFTGLETYEEVRDYAYKVFPDVHASSFKVGKMGDAPCRTFGDMRFRTFLRENRLAPSKTNIWVVQDNDAGSKPPKKMPRLYTERESEDEVVLTKVEGATNVSAVAAGASEKPNLVQTIPQEDIVVKELIEEGGCRPVFKGTWKGNEVALKKFALAKRQDATLFKQVVSDEVLVHASIRHPNILQLYGICEAEEGKVFYIVMELMDTSLDRVIFSGQGSRGDGPKGKKQVEIALKVVRGIEYLHDKKIVHGDVKPSNVLTSKEETDVKVCDFGMARVKNNPGVTKVDTPAGTVMFMAPEELLSGVRGNFKTDSWALAATLTELFTGEQFWCIPKRTNATEYIKAQMEKQHVSNGMAALKKKNKKLYQVLEGCYSYVAEARDSVHDLYVKLARYMNDKKY